MSLPAGVLAGVSTAIAVLVVAARLAAARAGTSRADIARGGTRRAGVAATRPSWRTRVRLGSRRGAAPGDVEVADWCDDVARALRSGDALSSAIAQATAAHPALGSTISPVLDAIRRGRSLAAALAAQPVDSASPVALAISVLRTCADLGGPAAAPLERVAATLRTRAAISEEHRAHSAQALLSARVLTMVPLALLGLLVVVEARVRASLGTPAGLAAVGAGVVLNVTGWRWMRRIIGRPP